MPLGEKYSILKLLDLFKSGLSYVILSLDDTCKSPKSNFNISTFNGFLLAADLLRAIYPAGTCRRNDVGLTSI